MVETSGLALAFACAAVGVLSSAGPLVMLLPVSVRWSPAGSWTLDRTREETQARVLPTPKLGPALEENPACQMLSYIEYGDWLWAP